MRAWFYSSSDVSVDYLRYIIGGTGLVKPVSTTLLMINRPSTSRRAGRVCTMSDRLASTLHGPFINGPLWTLQAPACEKKDTLKE